MQTKTILILITILLTIALSGLIFYSYYSKTKLNSENQADSTNSTVSQKTESTTDPNLEKIKNKIEPENPEIYLPEDGQLEEEDLEKIKNQPVNSAIGIIKNQTGSNLTISFDYQGSTWEAIVKVDEKTFIHSSSSSPNSIGEEINLSDLKVGNKVIVNVEGEITNKSNLTAISIVRI